MNTMTYEDCTLMYCDQQYACGKYIQTYNNLQGQRNYVFPVIGQIPIHDFSETNFMHMAEILLKSSLTYSYAQTLIAFSRKVLDFAYAQRLGPKIAFSFTRFSKEGDLICHPVDLQEHLVFLRAIEELPLNNLFGFCYFSGISPYTAVRLKKSEIDLQAKTVVSPLFKNDGVPLPLYDEAIPYLEKEKQRWPPEDIRNPRTFFLGKSQKNPVPSREVWENIRLLKKKMNLPDFTCQDLENAHYTIQALGLSAPHGLSSSDQRQ